MRTTQDLGLMVHGVRTRHQPTQAELAVRLGVSRRYSSELETGRPKVPNAKLLPVLDQLGVGPVVREVVHDHRQCRLHPHLPAGVSRMRAIGSPGGLHTLLGKVARADNL
ncbi:helix-turn-helix domain-containing protein [Arthrobacter wenxiniae]|uniref:Helix-turn-helix domain-containing protein n=1 Tax=Arthrobacter wenxiniae TaxID=2713570 RepID=A0A7Y7IF72_9MICC|nr:helix-turn-helix domain-containing protein [Arthrobacter wenxiniae]